MSFRLQIVLKDDGGADLVDDGFVLPCFLMQATVYHGLMSQHRREALVIEFDRDAGLCLSPAVDELLHTLQILAGLSVHLSRLAYDDSFNGFSLYVLDEPFVEFRCSDSRQPSGNKLQRVGDCHAGTLPAIVDG